MLLGKFVRRLVPAEWKRQLRNFRILATEYGQFNSIRKNDCVDSDNKEIPWYTYPAIEYLSQFDFRSMKVVEYGSGNSTIWWLEKGAKLISIEDDTKWYERVNAKLNKKANIDYKLVKTKSSYVEQIEISKANIIVIDGKYRRECIEYAINNMSDDCSLIIFDNSDRYPKTMKFISEATKWVRCDFIGFGPMNGYCWSTTIFINPQREPVRCKNVQPRAGLREISEDD